MQTIGIRELKEQASAILRRVREEGHVFEVTYHGQVIARLVPVTQPKPATSRPDFWFRWDRLARAVSARWPDGVSAVDAVREERREL